MEGLWRPFAENGFLLNALLAGILVSVLCACAGTFVVLRGLAFVGDALAPGVLPGVAVAVLLGAPSLAGAVNATLACPLPVSYTHLTLPTILRV